MSTIVIKTQKEWDALQRLLSKTKKDTKIGCWIFTGSKSKHGYGKFYFNKKHIEAHRVSYAFFKGKLKKGLDVSHDCDNPACINPKHLRLLSRRENQMDSVKRGITKTGFQSKFSILTKSQVLEAKRLKSLGWSNKNIANKFSVNQETVRRHVQRLREFLELEANASATTYYKKKSNNSKTKSQSSRLKTKS